MTTVSFLARSDDLYFIDQEIEGINHVTEKGLGINNLLFMQVSVTSSHSEGGNVNQMSRIQKVSSSLC